MVQLRLVLAFWLAHKWMDGPVYIGPNSSICSFQYYVFLKEKDFFEDIYVCDAVCSLKLDSSYASKHDQFCCLRTFLDISSLPVGQSTCQRRVGWQPGWQTTARQSALATEIANWPPGGLAWAKQKSLVFIQTHSKYAHADTSSWKRDLLEAHVVCVLATTTKHYWSTLKSFSCSNLYR